MRKTRKVLCAVLVVVMVLVCFTISVFASTEHKEGYYTYIVNNNEATIIDVDSSINGDITIPSTLGGYEVTAIGGFAFSMCAVTDVTIPNTVKSIGNWAFTECTELERVTIPDSVTSIGKWAFSACIKLSNVILSNNLSAINDYTFYMCRSLSSVTIGKDVTAIGVGAFAECFALTHIEVDANNQAYSSDEYGVLYNKNKTSLIMYPTGNNRKSYDIPEGVIEIAPYAFGSCLLERLTIPESVTTIGSAAFVGCRLESINIPSKITSIAEHTFNSCDNLRSITISNSIKSIGDHAFHSSDNLTDIYFYGTKNEWNNIAISDNNTPIFNATVHYLLEETGEPDTPNTPNDEKTLTFFEKIVEFFRNLFDKLFGWMKR